MPDFELRELRDWYIMGYHADGPGGEVGRAAGWGGRERERTPGEEKAAEGKGPGKNSAKDERISQPQTISGKRHGHEIAGSVKWW